MVFAAFMTPGGDPISMMILAAAITLLVELAFQFCRINDKRRGEQRPEWLDLDDEQSSGPIAASGPDRKSTRLNSSHVAISYAVFCLKKKIAMYEYVVSVCADVDSS